MNKKPDDWDDFKEEVWRFMASFNKTYVELPPPVETVNIDNAEKPVEGNFHKEQEVEQPTGAILNHFNPHIGETSTP